MVREKPGSKHSQKLKSSPSPLLEEGCGKIVPPSTSNKIIEFLAKFGQVLICNQGWKSRLFGRPSEFSFYCGDDKVPGLQKRIFI